MSSFFDFNSNYIIVAKSMVSCILSKLSVSSCLSLKIKNLCVSENLFLVYEFIYSFAPRKMIYWYMYCFAGQNITEIVYIEVSTIMLEN